jgi:transcriptional regulator with XRE-family HTH domain
MKLKNISQEEPGRLTGISQSEISRIVNGKNLNVSTAQRIAKALGRTIDYLWPY